MAYTRTSGADSIRRWADRWRFSKDFKETRRNSSPSPIAARAKNLIKVAPPPPLPPLTQRLIRRRRLLHRMSATQVIHQQRRNSSGSWALQASGVSCLLTFLLLPPSASLSPSFSLPVTVYGLFADRLVVKGRLFHRPLPIHPSVRPPVCGTNKSLALASLATDSAIAAAVDSIPSHGGQSTAAHGQQGQQGVSRRLLGSSPNAPSATIRFASPITPIGQFYLLGRGDIRFWLTNDVSFCRAILVDNEVARNSNIRSCL